MTGAGAACEAERNGAVAHGNHPLLSNTATLRRHFFAGFLPFSFAVDHTDLTDRSHENAHCHLSNKIFLAACGLMVAADRLEVFVNGVLEATNAFPYVRTANPNPLTIGETIVFPGRFFSGSIDEVQVYDRALSAAEIQAIYNAGSAGLCRPLLVRIYTAVEIGWRTETNRQYQVQRISQFATNDWQNFGVPIQGTGSNIYLFDSTRDREKCFYRVLTLPP